MSTRNVVWTGGPPGGHDFDELSSCVAGLLADDDIASTIVSDPDDLVDHLTGPDPLPDLVTVLALRWTMGADRYAHLRDEWAYSADERLRHALTSYVDGGGGLLALHTACVCFDDWPGWGDLLGASWNWSTSWHPPLGPIHVAPTGEAHPITEGVGPFDLDDEVYGFLDERPGLRPLAVSAYDGRDHPVLWARSHGAGRVVVDTLGHQPASWEHPSHRLLLSRSARWATRQARRP